MSGSKKTRLTPLQKILLGGGVLRNIHKANGGRIRKHVPVDEFDEKPQRGKKVRKDASS